LQNFIIIQTYCWEKTKVIIVSNIHDDISPISYFLPLYNAWRLSLPFVVHVGTKYTVITNDDSTLIPRASCIMDIRS